MSSNIVLDNLSAVRPDFPVIAETNVKITYGSEKEFNDSGFLITNPVLLPGECDQLLVELSRPGMNRSRAGARHLMGNPAIAALANDSRLLNIARRAIGSGATPYRATLFEKTPGSNWLVVWHQDTALPLTSRFNSPGWGPWSEKGGITYAHAPDWVLARIVALRVHLDASGIDNGPLRVMPGSHKVGLLSDQEVFAYAATREFTECVIARGGVMAMAPLLVHSSPKVRSMEPRRVLHIEYADSLDLAPDIRLAIA